MQYLHPRVVPKDVAKRYIQWYAGKLEEEWIAIDHSVTLLFNKFDDAIAQVANYNLKTEKQVTIERPKRFCFFIKAIDGDIHKPFVKYKRYEEFFLALRIGYFKEAYRIATGKPSNYIWEGLEDNPMPF